MSDHEIKHAAGPDCYQVNGVQAEDFTEVVPSRQAAIAYATEIFSGASASAATVITAAEAIHQFLVGTLKVPLVDEEGRSLFPVNNCTRSVDDLNDVGPVGRRNVCVPSAACVVGDPTMDECGGGSNTAAMPASVEKKELRDD